MAEDGERAGVVAAESWRERDAGSGSGTRRRRLGGAELIETLDETIGQLIGENELLRQRLARLSGPSPQMGDRTVERTLRSLYRRVERAVSAAPRRRSPGAPPSRRRTSRRRPAASEQG